MADHDPLTGLLNRRRMHKELVAAVSLAKRHGETFALVFVDLDRFKAVNDSHGHDAGDRYLSAFAEMLERVARESDKLGRWGGDEFVALLPRSARPGAESFAERLKDGLGRHHIDIGPIRITGAASIGIAEYPNDGLDPEALLAHADQDMYRVKRGPDRSTRTEVAA
jgi:diguanylate cyclase (GGDEF)-like protein